MDKHITASLFLSVSLFLSGCGGSGQGDIPATTPPPQEFTIQEKVFVRNLFLSEYLWYDQVDTEIDYLSYETASTLVRALRVDPPDKWSTVITQQQYEDYVNQQTAGFGFGYYAESFTIYMVRIDSPAWKKLQRGDRILTINHKPVTQELLHEASTALGEESIFTVAREGQIVDIPLTPQVYNFKVTDASIIDDNGKRIGYMRYDSFSNSSATEIEAAFSYFKSAQIDELVIDLRYNTGGATTIASILLDNITNRYPGQRQFYLDWNENYKVYNEDYNFEDADDQDGNELAMERVVFLVTKNSASASELTISALKPYLGDENVITVGTATHGKNVGMAGRVYGTNYYFLINFFIRNNADETTSFDGIPATCTAEDDLENLRGDPNESMLRTALFYLKTGSCP